MSRAYMGLCRVVEDQAYSFTNSGRGREVGGSRGWTIPGSPVYAEQQPFVVLYYLSFGGQQPFLGFWAIILSTLRGATAFLWALGDYITYFPGGNSFFVGIRLLYYLFFGGSRVQAKVKGLGSEAWVGCEGVPSEYCIACIQGFLEDQDPEP